MKHLARFPAFGLVVSLAAASAALVGCGFGSPDAGSAPTVPADTPRATGTLALTVALAGSPAATAAILPTADAPSTSPSQTIYPDLSGLTYRLEFSAESKTHDPETWTAGETTGLVELEADATWLVTAYAVDTSGGSPGTDVASATASVYITAGQRSTASLRLAPKTGGGNGYLAYTVDLSALGSGCTFSIDNVWGGGRFRKLGGTSLPALLPCGHDRGPSGKWRNQHRFHPA